MKEYLKNALPYVAAIIVLVIVGIGIEWYRRRGLQRWALEQGGTFDPGTLLEGTKVPEAAAFDALFADGSVVYANVSRIPKPEASYVLAQFEHRYKDIRNDQKSFSCVVCLITLPDLKFPEAYLSPNVFGTGIGYAPGAPPVAKVAVPDPVPGFAEKFEVRPVWGGKEIRSEALSALFSRDVQRLLLEQKDLISGLQVRGNTVRLEAISRQFGYPHRDVFEVARRLTAIWTATPGK